MSLSKQSTNKVSPMKTYSKVRSKSVCVLFPSSNTKPKAPNITGELIVLRETIQEIINTHREKDGDVYRANMAVWFYDKGGKNY